MKPAKLQNKFLQCLEYTKLYNKPQLSARLKLGLKAEEIFFILEIIRNKEKDYFIKILTFDGVISFIWLFRGSWNRQNLKYNFDPWFKLTCT